MQNRLRAPFAKALELATASILDVAEGIERGYRTLTAYRRGDRRVTPNAARRLAAYLRERARAFNIAADRLDAAADEEEER
jgi:hypothetical protein